jgi:hypothetical protein
LYRYSRVLLVAEGAAELRKLIEVELVDANGDKVPGGRRTVSGAGVGLALFTLFCSQDTR